jgi:CheY-like chemotaxis protein
LAPALPAFDHPEKVAMPAPQPTVNLKLLIVDDDPNTRDLLAEALEVRGARVRALASASEARTTLIAWHPDLMISDVGMPRENGYELIRRVRHLSVRDGGTTPAIACTGYTRPEDRARAMRAGFDAVVTKPVNLEELLQTIVQVACVRGPVAVDDADAAPDDGAPGPEAEDDDARTSAPDS